MQLTVLGWQGPFPGVNGACSGYLLTANSGEALLLDAGTGTATVLAGLRAPETLSAILLSHLHWDHISDLLPLSYRKGMQNVPVYVQTEPAAAYSALSSAGLQLHVHEACTMGPFHISFCSGRHPVPGSAIRVECDGKVFVYTGDTNTSDAVENFCTGADVLLADSAFTLDTWQIDRPHMSAYHCACMAKKAGVKKLILTHLPSSGDTKPMLDEAKAVFSDTVLAGRMMEVQI